MIQEVLWNKPIGAIHSGNRAGLCGSSQSGFRVFEIEIYLYEVTGSYIIQRFARMDPLA
jgi:hypothetical protein